MHEKQDWREKKKIKQWFFITQHACIQLTIFSRSDFQEVFKESFRKDLLQKSQIAEGNHFYMTEMLLN